jgi:hypothetical protein
MSKRFPNIIIIILMAALSGLMPADPAPAREATVKEMKQLTELGEIYVLTADQGQRAGIQIDERSHEEAHLVKVAVNRPGRPVTLVLSCRKPAVWHIGWSEGSRIAAVATVGEYVQKTAGLPPGVPVIHLPLDRELDRAPENFMTKIVQDLFNKEPDQVIGSVNGYLTVGFRIRRDQPLFTEAAFEAEKFRWPGAPKADIEGLREAIRNGWLKPATVADARPCFKNAEAPSIDKQGYFEPDSGWVNPSHYLVVSPNFVFPAGLYGAHSGVFYIAKGLDRPKGRPGHSVVTYLSTCTGSPENKNVPDKKKAVEDGYGSEWLLVAF